MAEIPLNVVREAPVHLVKPSGQVVPFGGGATTNALRGTALIAAAAAAAAGDLILLTAATFDLAISRLLVPASVHVRGRGMYATIITGSSDTSVSPQVRFASNQVWSDLSLINTVDTAAGAGNAEGDSAFTGVVLQGVRVRGVADGFYIDVANCSATLYQCELSSDIDTLCAFGASQTFNLYGCRVEAVGSSSGFPRPVNVDSTGTVNVFGGAVAVVGDSGGNGGSVTTNGGTLNLYNVAVTLSGSVHANTKNLRNTSGTIRVSTCDLDPARTSGTITYADTLRGVVPGATGLALLDDATASAARDTLGASSGVFPVSVGGSGVSSLTANRVVYGGSGGTSLAQSANFTFDGTTAVLAGSTNNSTFRVGTVEFQSFGLNNGWIGENIYFTGSVFTRRATGSGVLFYFSGNEGQFRCFASGTGDVDNHVNVKFNNAGDFGVGVSISNTPGTYTGAVFRITGSTGAASFKPDGTNEKLGVTSTGVAIGGGTAVTKILSATATLDFPSTATNTSSELTITVTGAAVGDSVEVGLPAAPDANACFTGYVSAADTVKVRFNNYSAGAIDPASGSYRATVLKF